MDTSRSYLQHGSMHTFQPQETININEIAAHCDAFLSVAELATFQARFTVISCGVSALQR